MDWAAAIKEQEGSGLGVREFCQGRGISTSHFYMRRARLRNPQAAVGKFARVESLRQVRLELEGGLVVKVEISDLKEVLAALR